jgi:hypothetical protein
MKTSLLICGAMLTLASTAFAGGHINMAWTDCVPSAAAAGNLNNTCLSTSNNFVGLLVTSFGVDSDVPNLIGCSGTIDLQTDTATLSPWWHAEPGGCRSGLIGWNADFTNGLFTTCIDVWSGLATGGSNYAVPSPGVPFPTGNGPNTARIRTVQSIVEPGADILSVDPNTGAPNEYYAFKIAIRRLLSTGSGACAGCLDRACLVFNSLTLTSPSPAPDIVLTTGPVQVATYNGGTGAALCPGATPNHKSTWGSVKSLYR